MLHSSPRDKKRHIVSYDLPRNWEVFSYPVELWATRHRLVATCGKMPKGILLVARTIHQEIRKDIFSMWDSPSFWGVFFYPVNLRVARPRLATTRGKMPKGILLIARTVQQEIRKDICCIWDSPSIWGVFCAGICKGFSVARSCLLGYS